MVISKELCCGCEACRQICPQKCIDMREDEEGYLYPWIKEEQCSKCNICKEVCPVLDIKKGKFE